MKMPIFCYIGLGSNMNDRLGNLLESVGLINKWPESRILKSSMVYETEPWGVIDQAPFFNAVIEIATELSPLDLLRKCFETENQMGRVRSIKWGPRTIDIDILFYGTQIYQTDSLQIPHPRITERDFVIIPLNEIAPDFVHPASHTTIHLIAAGFDVNRLRQVGELIIEPKEDI